MTTSNNARLHNQAALGEGLRAGIDELYRRHGVTPTRHTNAAYRDGHTNNEDLVEELMQLLPPPTAGLRPKLRTMSRQTLQTMRDDLSKPGRNLLRVNERDLDAAPLSSFKANTAIGPGPNREEAERDRRRQDQAERLQAQEAQEAREMRRNARHFKSDEGVQAMTPPSHLETIQRLQANGQLPRKGDR